MLVWTGRAFMAERALNASIRPRETSTVSLKTFQRTPSEQGGVASEPMYGWSPSPWATDPTD